MKNISKNSLHRISILLCLALTAASISSCSEMSETTQSNISTGVVASSSDQPAEEATTLSPSSSVTFTEEDFDVSYADTLSATITGNGTTADISGSGVTANGGYLQISSAGTYLITGSLTDGQILIDAGEDDVVRLVLSDAEITCLKSAPVYVKDAKKVIIILQEGTRNILCDTALMEYDDVEKEEPNAVIFSKSDLTITGTGSLSIEGSFLHGINSKDGLKIVSGSIDITSVQDAIRGNDYVAIRGGELSISAGDDAIHSDALLLIDNGTITINTSYEGLEGAEITINGGEFHINSEDDGINVAGGVDSSGDAGFAAQDPFATTGTNNLFINGGYIYVNASGDGIDANASITMTGGSVIVCGPTNDGNGAIDYAGSFTVTGGLLIAAGSRGMAQSPDNSSAQNTVMINTEDVKEAGTIIQITGANGDEILTFSPVKEYSSIVLCSPDLLTGSTYSVNYGGTADTEAKDGLYTDGSVTDGTLGEEFTVASVVTNVGQSSQGMGGGMGGDKDGDRPEPGQRPEGGMQGELPPDANGNSDFVSPKNGQVPPDGTLPTESTQTGS